MFLSVGLSLLIDLHSWASDSSPLVFDVPILYSPIPCADLCPQGPYGFTVIPFHYHPINWYKAGTLSSLFLYLQSLVQVAGTEQHLLYNDYK